MRLFVSPEKFIGQNFFQTSDSSGIGRLVLRWGKRATGSHLIEEPCRKDHLEQVIDYQGVLKLERFPILHELRPEHLDDVDVSDADEQRGEGRAHQ